MSEGLEGPFSKDNIVIYEASAGSGKTYQIALSYLKLLRQSLSSASRGERSGQSLQPGFKDIIAITFTNKAVFEMKERIIRFLKEIALETERGKEISAQTGIGREDAERLLEEIFLNYDFLEVRTIDSFLLKFFRSLAYEFDLHPNFDVKTYLDSSLLERALYNLYLRSLEEEEIRDFLEEFVNFLLTKESKLRINFKRRIVNQLKEFIKDFTYNDRLALFFEIRDSKYSDTIVSERGRLYFQLFNLLKNELEKLLLEEGIIYMGYWKEKLAQNIHRDFLPWIYVKLGKIRAFIIDEFQDTDRLQWMALTPLVEELASDGRTLVIAGDPKQSIYRWKGGDPRLLIEIREKFKNHNLTLRPLRKNYRSAMNLVKFNNLFFRILIEGLPRTQILERLVFGSNKGKHEELLKKAERQLLELFENIEQDHHRDLEGRVYIHWLEFPEKQEKEELFEEMVRTIGDLVSSLKSEGDEEEIVILCRENEEVAEVANYLTSLGFKVVGSTFLRLKESPLINGLIAFLKLFYGREVDLSLATILMQFFESDGEEILKRYRKFKINSKGLLGLLDYVKTYHPEFWRENFEEIFEKAVNLNLYQFITYIVDRFKLEARFSEERAYLYRFLSLLLRFLAKGGDREEFLDNLEALLEENVEVIHDEKVVQVMTLHASKGLEFDRVIIPLNFSLGKGKNGSGFLITDEGIFKGRLEELPEELQEYYISLRTVYNLEILSLLYVGFTRAIRELHLLVPCGLKSLPVSAEIFIRTFEAMKAELQRERTDHFPVVEISVPRS